MANGVITVMLTLAAELVRPHDTERDAYCLMGWSQLTTGEDEEEKPHEGGPVVVIQRVSGIKLPLGTYYRYLWVPLGTI